MPKEIFALTLVTGAAVLALWFNVQLPKLAPVGLRALIVHAVLAFVALQLIPGDASSAARIYVVLFGIALPALIYIFLVAIWFIRHAQGMLGSASR